MAEKFGYIGTLDHSDALFPLTPTHSLGERERHSTTHENSNNLRFAA